MISEDLLQIELAGNIAITHNRFGQNDYEECVDIKPQGRPGTSIVFSHNIVDSRHNGVRSSDAIGCRQGGILFHQRQTVGTTVIEGNWFRGERSDGGNLIRSTHVGTQVINNLFDDTQLTISADDLILGYNTFLKSGPVENRQFGCQADRSYHRQQHL